MLITINYRLGKLCEEHHVGAICSRLPGEHGSDARSSRIVRYDRRFAMGNNNDNLTCRVVPSWWEGGRTKEASHPSANFKGVQYLKKLSI